MIELYQTEWCPSSRRVRQKLTELGLDFVAHQVPADRADRDGLEALLGSRVIPALVAGDDAAVGEDEILGYLAGFPESAEAPAHRERAEKMRREDLEEACPRLLQPASPDRRAGGRSQPESAAASLSDHAGTAAAGTVPCFFRK